MCSREWSMLFYTWLVKKVQNHKKTLHSQSFLFSKHNDMVCFDTFMDNRIDYFKHGPVMSLEVS